jgi:alpha/beta superfamily hydrolase
MEKLIVYCHGYDSGANTGKLKALKSAGFNAHCFQADVDPVEALTYLTNKIDNLLIDHLNQDIELVFVGTSLGGWTASRLSKLYKAKAVIINPSVDPANSLLKYGVSKDICEKYSVFAPHEGHKYFFAKYDEVIDNQIFSKNLTDAGFDVTIVADADHRFEKHFGLVIDYLKRL